MEAGGNTDSDDEDVMVVVEELLGDIKVLVLLAGWFREKQPFEDA